MFVHVVSEVLEEGDFLCEGLWEHFQGVVIFCSISFYVLYIPVEKLFFRCTKAKKKNMSVSSDPTDPNFLPPTLKFLLAWMTKCHKMKVICCSNLLFYDQ